MDIIGQPTERTQKTQVRRGSIDVPKKNISKYLYTEKTHDISILSFKCHLYVLKCFQNWNAYLSIDASIKMRGLRTGLGGNGDAIHNSDLLTVHSFYQVFESMTNLTNQAFQTPPLQDQKSEKIDMFCGYLECHSMILYAFLIFSSNFQKTKLWHHWIVRNFSSGRLIYIQILAVRVWVLHTLTHQTNRLQIAIW